MFAGVTVAIQGVGHVGAYLAEKLHAAGAKLIIADVNAQAVDEVAKATGAQAVSVDGHMVIMTFPQAWPSPK